MAPSRPRPWTALLLLALIATACDHYAAADAVTGSTVTPHLTPAPSAAAELTGCASPAGVELPVAVDPLRAGDGRCIPFTDAVLYRCDPAFDPMMVLDADGTRRRYLGGRYAVPLAELPSDARRIGIGTSGRVYEVPSVPPMVVVEEAGTYERWLALPDPSLVGSPPTVTVIGDSIAEGASSALIEELSAWTPTIDGEIGRTSFGAVSAAESMLTLPDVVVFELGVNDTSAEAFASNAATALAVVRDADLVAWITAHGPEAVTDEIDRAIVTAMGGAANGTVLDWDGAVPPDALSSDGVHLEDGSGTVFAEFLAPTLDTWREAVAGEGPDRCGGRIAALT